MNFPSWLETIPPEITRDPLWNMEVYRIALFVGEIAWTDVCKLAQDRRMLEVSDQLYRAVGSISANIAEGYSKASKKTKPVILNIPSVLPARPATGTTKLAMSSVRMFSSTVPACLSKSSAHCSKSSPNFAARKSPRNRRSTRHTRWRCCWRIFRLAIKQNVLRIACSVGWLA